MLVFREQVQAKLFTSVTKLCELFLTLAQHTNNCFYIYVHTASSRRWGRMEHTKFDLFPSASCTEMYTACLLRAAFGDTRIKSHPILFLFFIYSTTDIINRFSYIPKNKFPLRLQLLHRGRDRVALEVLENGSWTPLELSDGRLEQLFLTKTEKGSAHQGGSPLNSSRTHSEGLVALKQ